MQKWRRADAHMNFFCPGLTQHTHNAVTRRTAHNRVIDHNHTLSFYCLAQYIQLHTHARFPAALLRFDEGPTDITVFHKCSAVWDARFQRISKRRCVSGLRYTDNKIRFDR